MRPLDLTASGIVRALSSIDDAVRDKAEALTARISDLGIEARMEAEGDAAYAVIASGEDLFAREFGGVDRQADAVIDAAVQHLKFGRAE
jgi:hypothetical protein